MTKRQDRLDRLDRVALQELRALAILGCELTQAALEQSGRPIPQIVRDIKDKSASLQDTLEQHKFITEWTEWKGGEKS